METNERRYGPMARRDDSVSRATELFEKSLRENAVVPESGLRDEESGFPTCQHLSGYMLAVYDCVESGSPPVCESCGKSWYWSDLSIAPTVEIDVSGA